MWCILKGYGAVLYSHALEDANVDGKILSIPGLRDRAYVQIGNTLGILFYFLNLITNKFVKNDF